MWKVKGATSEKGETMQCARKGRGDRVGKATMDTPRMCSCVELLIRLEGLQGC